MIIVIGKKDKKMLEDIRTYFIYRNRCLSTHNFIYNDFVYFVNRLSKILHINNNKI